MNSPNTPSYGWNDSSSSSQGIYTNGQSAAFTTTQPQPISPSENDRDREFKAWFAEPPELHSRSDHGHKSPLGLGGLSPVDPSIDNARNVAVYEVPPN